MATLLILCERLLMRDDDFIGHERHWSEGDLSGGALSGTERTLDRLGRHPEPTAVGAVGSTTASGATAVPTVWLADRVTRPRCPCDQHGPEMFSIALFDRPSCLGMCPTEVACRTAGYCIVSVNNPALTRGKDGLDTIADVEFAHRVLQIGLDRVGLQTQDVCDFAVAQTLGHLFQDVYLAPS